MMKIIAAVVFAVPGAMLGIWASDRAPTTDTIRVEVMPAIIAAGGEGEVVYTYQRFRQCPRRSVQEIIDATGRVYPVGIQESPPFANRLKERPDTFAQPIKIPLTARPGPAIYHVMIKDFCNPLHYVWPISKEINVPFDIGPQPGH